MLHIERNDHLRETDYRFQFELLPGEWYSFRLAIGDNVIEQTSLIMKGLDSKIQEMIKMQWQRAIHDMEVTEECSDA